MPSTLFRRPRIAVMLDENSSGDGRFYETGKDYFRALAKAGGAAFGIPYDPDLVAEVVEEFDGFVSVGGRIAFPESFYVDGDKSQFGFSERYAVDEALMRGFLALDKPVLGICNGMQMLACLHGAKMVSDLSKVIPGALVHDGKGTTHDVLVVPGSRLANLTQSTRFTINSRHREAITEVSDDVVISARAPDSVIEAIEVPAYAFAIGLQWHQENFWAEDHPGNGVFREFVAACMG